MLKRNLLTVSLLNSFSILRCLVTSCQIERVYKISPSLSRTNDVLDETITLLFRRLPFHQARESLEKIEEAIETGYLILERINPERFEKAKELRLRYQDKPLISFTDFTSAVVMTEKGIDAILTEDKHFTYLEAGFRRVP